MWEWLQNNFGSLLEGGIGTYGYKQLMDQLKDQQGEFHDRMPGLRSEVEAAGKFTPWSVKSGLGTSSYNPATGQMDSTLSGTQQGYSDFMGQGAQNMFGRAGTNAFAGQAQNYFDRAAVDPAQREQDIYERTRAMQRPGEERQYSSMNANLFGGGRGGMTSGEFGGSPEQMAFGKAQAEARNQASFGAMQQAQQEMQNYQAMGANMYGLGQQDQNMYGALGNQMFQNQYMPHQMQQGYMGMGLQNQGLVGQSQQNMSGLLAQLGLGEMTTDVNYGNVYGGAFGELMKALGSSASGLQIPG